MFQLALALVREWKCEWYDKKNLKGNFPIDLPKRESSLNNCNNKANNNGRLAQFWKELRTWTTLKVEKFSKE